MSLAVLAAAGAGGRRQTLCLAEKIRYRDHGHDEAMLQARVRKWH